MALAGIALPTAQAAAQTPDDNARAEAAFNAGKQLREAGHDAEACLKFAESEHLSRGVGVMLHLADCYERVGRTASAWAKFREAEQVAFRRGDSRATLAHTRAAALEPKLNRLTVVVAHPESHADWQLWLDGLPLPREDWNAEVATDPGEHVVTVSAPGQTSRTLHARVDATKPEAVVTADDAAGADASSAPVAPPGASPPPEAEGTSASNARASVFAERVLLGATVVGVGLGVSFLAVKNQAVSNSRPGTSNDSSWAGPASGIAFASAGAALAAAIVVYLVAPREKSTGAIVVPAPMVGGGGAVLRTSF